MKKVNKGSKFKVDFNSNENLTSTPISSVTNGIRGIREATEQPKMIHRYGSATFGKGAVILLFF